MAATMSNFGSIWRQISQEKPTIWMLKLWLVAKLGARFLLVLTKKNTSIGLTFPFN